MAELARSAPRPGVAGSLVRRDAGSLPWKNSEARGKLPPGREQLDGLAMVFPSSVALGCRRHDATSSPLTFGFPYWPTHLLTWGLLSDCTRHLTFSVVLHCLPSFCLGVYSSHPHFSSILPLSFLTSCFPSPSALPSTKVSFSADSSQNLPLLHLV